ncbi:YhcN/YlaJ family sporulation lipoprotein [Fictibacillus phosphorivorans]|uniref:YhcN/YlaJ family sporulation lipoprotein n=1 Tax=Fictibacillus phosphorivorans TaxID=1221500 RepID=UPI00203DC929|nr:YhcN/YlaJ family sporulation lipoprotein [Fictibacillus phosphorivorans]MCM3717304.1 YhcN/YlaJ family sporulation lipoprotein [Fictibacillus phosphorivorans]MCM3774991.1 YhcN/YlaJ family sporulation lipoprotein [Fictibacillus phosphorivorans]
MKTLRIAAVMSAIFVLFGCMNENNNNAQQSDKNTPRLTKVNQTAQGKKQAQPKGSQEVSKHLVSLATGIPGVEDATAVVLGPYAVVGIDVDRSLDNSRVGSIKYSVTEALKDDPNGRNAVVTADPDLVERLRQMGKQIRQGHPIGGIMNELAGIVGRLMPQVPHNLDTDKPSPTETNNGQLSEKEERELKNNQQKQEKSKKNQPQRLKNES